MSDEITEKDVLTDCPECGATIVAVATLARQHILLILQNQRAMMWEVWATNRSGELGDCIDATDAAIKQLKGEK